MPNEVIIKDPTTGMKVTVTNGKLNVNATVSGSGDGTIQDGVDNGIEATVLDYTNSNPIAVRLTDTDGDYAAAGGGTEYTEGDTDASITGKAILAEGSADTLKVVKCDDDGAIHISDGGNSITIDGTIATTQSGTWNIGTLTGITNTVTVDGAVTANAGTNLNTSALATSANQLLDGHNVTVDNASGASAINIQDGGNTITIDGTLTGITNDIAIVDGGNSITVDGTFWQGTQPVSATDLDIRDLTHVSDSVKIGDGTETTNVNASNELQVRDDDTNTVLGTIDTDTGVIAGDTTSIDGKITTCNTGAVVVSSGTLTAITAITNALPAGNNNIGNVDIASALPSGTNAIGKLVANSGVDIGDVDVTSQPARDRLTDNIGVALQTDTILNDTTALTPKFAKIDIASSGENTIVSAVAGKKIRVLSLFVISAGTVTLGFEDSDNTDLTGSAIPLIANSGFVLPFNPVGWFQTASVNKDLDIELSAAIAVDGCLTYVEV